jgi:hypothetical protein
MLGKSLNARYELSALAPARATALLTQAMSTQAESIVLVRAQNASMVACVVVRADRLTLRTCRALGLDIKEGKSGVFGLQGADAARLFDGLRPHQIEWLETPATARETKVLLLSGAFALISLTTQDGKVALDVLPAVTTPDGVGCPRCPQAISLAASRS